MKPKELEKRLEDAFIHIERTNEELGGMKLAIESSKVDLDWLKWFTKYVIGTGVLASIGASIANLFK